MIRMEKCSIKDMYYWHFSIGRHDNSGLPEMQQFFGYDLELVAM